MTGYLARPAGAGPWPAVLLGFEMFGITGYLRAVAAQVAAAGYLALVPDFYHWQSPAASTPSCQPTRRTGPRPGPDQRACAGSRSRPTCGPPSRSFGPRRTAPVRSRWSA